MSQCKNCKYCNQAGLSYGRWYCQNPDNIISGLDLHDLPFASEHAWECFWRLEKQEQGRKQRDE